MNPKYRGLTNDQLYDLHWHKGMAMAEIGRLLGVCGSSVSHAFRKRGITTRKGTALRARVGILKKPSRQLSYIIGVMFGDGNICKNGRSKVAGRMRLKVADKAFADSFYAAAQNIGYKPQRSQGTGSKAGVTYYVVCFDSVEFARWWTKQAITERLSMAGVYSSEFIRGLYESEGSLFPKNGRLRITINTDDIVVMSYTDGLLRGMGYNTGFYSVSERANGKQQHRIELSGQAQVYRFLTEFQPCIKNTSVHGNTEPSSPSSDGQACVETIGFPPDRLAGGEDMVRACGKPQEAGRNDLPSPKGQVTD